MYYTAYCVWLSVILTRTNIIFLLAMTAIGNESCILAGSIISIILHDAEFRFLGNNESLSIAMFILVCITDNQTDAVALPVGQWQCKMGATGTQCSNTIAYHWHGIMPLIRDMTASCRHVMMMPAPPALAEHALPESVARLPQVLRCSSLAEQAVPPIHSFIFPQPLTDCQSVAVHHHRFRHTMQ